MRINKKPHVHALALLLLLAGPLLPARPAAAQTGDPQPVVWLGDFNNFDDAVALMLIAKDPRYDIKLIVVDESFNAVAPGINTTFNILEWLHHPDVEVIRGAYHGDDEVRLGGNGDAVNTPDADGNYALPNADDNPERFNTMGVNLYGQYVPGPWRDNGATLYGTEHLIPRARQARYHYSGNRGRNRDFELAEDLVIATINDSAVPVILLGTGKLTTMARVLTKTAAESSTPLLDLSKVSQVIIMGGGFQGFMPFTEANQAACFGNRTLNLGGNIFSHPSFGCGTDFSTHQEFNILLDPVSAQTTFDTLAAGNVPTWIVPTNGTDLAKLEHLTINALDAPSSGPQDVRTEEARYVAELFRELREFEGGDKYDGDFVLDAVIRLWDVIAALLLLDPSIVAAVKSDACIDVEQLDAAALLASATPYDPISAQPTVGKTTFAACDAGALPPNVLLAIDVDGARQRMIDRLRDPLNAARRRIVWPR
jgi:inosine-uridine nucleoside N-ribohydrolase